MAALLFAVAMLLVLAIEAGEFEGFDAHWHELRTLKGHTDRIEVVAFSHDDELIVSAGYDTTVRLWNVTSGQQLWRLDGHTDRVAAVDLSFDNELAVSGGDDSSVRIWNVTSGQEIKRLVGHTGRVFGVAISRDKVIVASGDSFGHTNIWNATSGQVLKTRIFGKRINSMTISKDGHRVLVGTERRVYVWDIQDEREPVRLELEDGGIGSMAFSRDENLVVVGSNTGTVFIWNSTSGQKIHQLEGHLNEIGAAIFSYDGESVISADFSKIVRTWDVDSGEKQLVYNFYGDLETSFSVESLGLSRNGELVAVGDSFHIISVWGTTGLQTPSPSHFPTRNTGGSKHTACALLLVAAFTAFQW